MQLNSRRFPKVKGGVAKFQLKLYLRVVILYILSEIVSARSDYSLRYEHRQALQYRFDCTERWTDRQTGRHTNGHAYKQTTRQRHRHTNGQSNRQTSGQRSKETYSQTMIIHTAVDIDKKYPPIYIYEKQRSPNSYNDQEYLYFMMFSKPPAVCLLRAIIPFFPNGYKQQQRQTELAAKTG